MISTNDQAGGPEKSNPKPGLQGPQSHADKFSPADPPFGHGFLPNGVCSSLPNEKRPLDSANHFGVACDGLQFGIMKIPVRWMARDEAINLAAWLVAIADPERKDFERVLAEIRK